MLANGLVITVRVACFYEKCCFVRNEFDVVEYKDASVDRWDLLFVEVVFNLK